MSLFRLINGENSPQNYWNLHNLKFLIGIQILLLLTPTLDAFDCFVMTIFNLKTADCNEKSYKDIPKGFDHELQVLQFNDNELTYLGADEFLPYPRLQDIFLDRNKIDTIFPHAFRGLYNLQVLSLQSNKLNTIPVESLQHLESVRILNFRANQIRQIESYSLQSLINIEDITFENNYISYIDPHAFSGLYRLTEINLVNNELKTLSAEMQVLLPQKLDVFRIYGNPWLCDCQLRWLRTWLSTSKQSEVNWDFAQNTPTCNEPELIANVNWKHLDAPHFACAARIESNTSTSQQVVLGGNITIECDVYGDPEPKITWLKGTKPINKNGLIRKYTISEVGIKHIKSTLTLQHIELEDMTDYKCKAQNNAGISEVTYKLWAEGVIPPQKQAFFFGLSKEIILGIAIGGALLTLTLLCVVVGFLCKQQDRRKREYKVRAYRNPSNGERKQSQSPSKSAVNHTSGNKNGNARADNHQISAERKELLTNKQQNVHTIDRAQPVSNGNRVVSTVVNDPNNSFKLKMYATYDRAQDGVTLENGEDRNQGPSHIQRTLPGNETRDTPDLLKDGGNNLLPSPRAIPVPPPVVPSHISSCHPRAEENPYVKPSDLRSQTLKRKTASADDLLDGTKDQLPDFRRSSRSRDDLDDYSRSKPRDVSAYGTVSRSKHKEHSTSCKNPVCLKDPNLGLDTQDFTQRSRLKSPPKMVGVYREIDVDDLMSPESRGGGGYYGDTYKTLPGRLSKYDQRDKDHYSMQSSSVPTQHVPTSTQHQYTPTNSVQSNPSRTPTPQSSQRPSSRNRPPNTKTVSFSEQGHPIIDLTQEMPAPIVITTHRKPAPPARGEYSAYGQARGYGPVSHMGPGQPQMSHVGSGQHHVSHGMRGPENISGVVPSSHKAPMSGIYGTHKAPIPNGSPGGRLSRQGTTLDDLLSPPFGHVQTAQRSMQGSKTLPHKRKNHKPGAKDEFGTAV